MMWLVQLALRRPLTVAVMAALMLVLGLLSFYQMKVDIFPAIRLPVVLVVWNYPGLAAFQMERRMVWISERAYSTTVNDIDHIESQSLITIPGFSTPAPLGGVQRAVMVNLDPLRLYALGLSPQQVGQALASTNVVIPSGVAKMGKPGVGLRVQFSSD